MRDSTRLPLRMAGLPATAIVLAAGFLALARGVYALPIDADEPPARPDAEPGPAAPGRQPGTFRAFVVGSISKGPDVDAIEEALLADGEDGPRFTSPLAAWTGVTDRFGVPRSQGTHHAGIDLGLRLHPGSRVVAACPGFVVAAGWSGGYGNRVVIDCGAGWDTLYAHLSLPLVVPGMFVVRGGVVGISGSTGYSTGEHLHFEIRRNGLPIDPELYIDFGLQPGVAVLGPLPGDPDASTVPGPAAPPPSPPAAVVMPAPAAPLPTPTPLADNHDGDEDGAEPLATTPAAAPGTATPARPPSPPPDPARAPPEPSPTPADGHPGPTVSPLPGPTPAPTRPLPWDPTGLDRDGRPPDREHDGTTDAGEAALE
jgi:hypothetical protein